VPLVTVRFYEELNDLLPVERRRRTCPRLIPGSATVGGLIEAEGVPRSRVDLVLVNGESVGFDHPLGDGDRVAVYPVFESFDIGPVQRVRPRPLRALRFVLDRQLGPLARRLRRLGLDGAHRDDWDAASLLEVAAREQRIVLTRDAGLLERAAVTRGYRVRASAPDAQVREVLERFDLRPAGTRADRRD
jgi:hypothetical protein